MFLKLLWDRCIRYYLFVSSVISYLCIFVRTLYMYF